MISFLPKEPLDEGTRVGRGRPLPWSDLVHCDSSMALMLSSNSPLAHGYSPVHSDMMKLIGKLNLIKAGTEQVFMKKVCIVYIINVLNVILYLRFKNITH